MIRTFLGNGGCSLTFYLEILANIMTIIIIVIIIIVVVIIIIIIIIILIITIIIIKLYLIIHFGMG